MMGWGSLVLSPLQADRRVLIDLCKNDLPASSLLWKFLNMLQEITIDGLLYQRDR